MSRTVRLGRPSAAELDRVLAAAREQEPTYDHVGSTLRLVSGKGTHQEHRDLGTGEAAFRAAVEGLRTWVTHRGIPGYVHPPGQRVELGATVVVVLRGGPISVIAPDRVVAVVDEARRFTYAYGTLPGHPEEGEESFTVELLDDGTVRATIRVEARPGIVLTRIAAPAVRLFQRQALRRYLEALAAHVAAAAR